MHKKNKKIKTYVHVIIIRCCAYILVCDLAVQIPRINLKGVPLLCSAHVQIKPITDVSVDFMAMQVVFVKVILVVAYNLV